MNKRDLAPIGDDTVGAPRDGRGHGRRADKPIFRRDRMRRSARGLAAIAFCVFACLVAAAEAAPKSSEAPDSAVVSPPSTRPADLADTPGKSLSASMAMGRPVSPDNPDQLTERPPDLAFAMHADAERPPADVEKPLNALVDRLKKDDKLALRMTVFAPVMASSGYTIGLATKAWTTLRKHLRDLGVPQQKIFRSGLQPGRATASADERPRIELRLIRME